MEPEWTEEDTDSYDTSEGEETTVIQIPWLALTSKIAVNLFVPFINGLMLGFGEIFAHELGLTWGWRSSRVYDPNTVKEQARARRRWLWFI